MTQYPQLLIGRLRTCTDAAMARDDVMASGGCLSKARILNFSSGIYPEIDRDGVTEAEAVALEHELVQLYRRDPNSTAISSVLWALAQGRNPVLRGLFIEHSKAAMQRLTAAYAELSQCIVGLEEFSKPNQVDSNRSGLMSEVIDTADAYLREAGIIVPVG